MHTNYELFSHNHLCSNNSLLEKADCTCITWCRVSDLPLRISPQISKQIVRITARFNGRSLKYFRKQSNQIAYTLIYILNILKSQQESRVESKQFLYSTVGIAHFCTLLVLRVYFVTKYCELGWFRSAEEIIQHINLFFAAVFNSLKVIIVKKLANLYTVHSRKSCWF